jgi:hypothetical protein
MNDFETLALIADAERVAERVKAMGVDQIIALWNERVADHYCRCIEVHSMNDFEWWGWLANELGAAEMVERLFESELNDWFMPNDLYFYYNDEEGLFHSFTDEENIFDALDLAVLVETLMND